MKVLVLDFGGSAIKHALVDDNAVMTENGKTPSPLSSREEFQATVKALYDRYKHEIEGIAISFPGFIDPSSGTLRDSGVYAGILKGCSVTGLIKDVCPVPVEIENDGKCGALAEAWKGRLSDVRDGIVLILGSGIGGGIIKDRKIHSGKGCTAGELSFFLTHTGHHDHRAIAGYSNGMIGMAFKACRLKNLDMDIQDAAPLIRMFDSLYHNDYPETEGEPLKIKADGRQIFKWLDEGDPAAQRIYKEFIEGLAAMIYNLQIAYAPDRFVIGGGLSAQDRIFTDLDGVLNDYYKTLDLPEDMHAVVTRSTYRDECNILGAMYNYLLRTGRI